MTTLKSSLILSLQDQVSGRMKAISAQVAAFQNRMRAASAPFMGLTARLAAVGGGYLAVTRGIGGTAGAAIKFEEAFADVRKVLDASDEQFANVRQQILNMSKVLPTSAEGIASIYAAAAQSNVPMNELGKFTEMVAKVAVAWDTTEAETSQALAEVKTQLNMNVDQIGLYADAINHLSNTTAARAPALIEYSRRVAAQGEMFGFSAQESLAFGSAMVAMGAEAEIAATSFRNMGKALTRGAGTKKEALRGWKRVGMDPKVVAKEMQKDAAKTTMKVIEAVQKVTKHERADIAFALFGEEARALMPIINDAKELRRQMDSVGRETNYAGSAFKEYMERANTTANVLAIMRNRIRYIGIEMGNKWLPTIKDVALAFSDVFDTLGDRVSIFDKIETSIKGFMQGLGYDGSIKEMVDDLADLFFGKIDPANGGDQLGALFMKMKGWGEAVREFNDAIKDNLVVKFVSEIAGYGFQFMLATMGIGLLAGAIMKLGRAMMFLSGASAAIAILKSLAGMGGALFGKLPGGEGKGKTGGKTPKGIPGGAFLGWMAMLGRRSPLIAALLTSGSTAGNDYVGADAETRGTMRDKARAGADAYNAAKRYREANTGLTHREERERIDPNDRPAYAPERVLHPSLMNENLSPATGMFQKFLDGMHSLAPKGDPLPTLESIRDAVGRPPAGVTSTREVNPTPVSAPINLTINVTSGASAQEIAAAAGARVQAALASHYSDGAYA